jgi:anti-anti-sigma regulatory factor
MSPTMSTHPTLPSELTIYTVNELRPQFMDWADQGTDGLRIQADSVAEVDAAGLQLLLSLVKSLAIHDRRLTLCNASARLSASCKALGIANLLDWDTEGAAHAQ